MDLDVRSPGIVVDPARLSDLERAVYDGEGRRLRISLSVVGDAEMAELHERYFDDPSVTDVITLDLSGDGPDDPAADDVDGEIVVNADLAFREATERGYAPASELLFYVAHGLLHLLGWDDADPGSQKRMLARQAHYLDAIGIHVDS
jgi:probable rRNA maturation factor